MSVAEFICIPGQVITRTRRAASEYNSAGTWVAGAPTDTAVEGVVHPATSTKSLSDSMIRELDNNRGRKTVIVYSVPDTWQTDDESTGTQADIMTYLGERYEILMVDEWRSGVLDHDKALAALLDIRDSD